MDVELGSTFIKHRSRLQCWIPETADAGESKRLPSDGSIESAPSVVPTRISCSMRPSDKTLASFAQDRRQAPDEIFNFTSRVLDNFGPHPDSKPQSTAVDSWEINGRWFRFHQD